MKKDLHLEEKLINEENKKKEIEEKIQQKMDYFFEPYIGDATEEAKFMKFSSEFKQYV